MTALTTASFSCSSYTRKATQSLGTYVINKGVDADAEELTPTPSLVGLAINYTLLVPIYLNWVVKLFADMEMYAGSVERIAGYTQQQQEQEELKQDEQEQPQQEELLHVDSRNEVDRSLAVDKVYPSATSAVTALALQEDSAKLNAPEQDKEVEEETNHLNLTTIKDARRQRQLAAAAADKAALTNEPAKRNKICEYENLIYHRFSGHILQFISVHH